jgi:hypothetical protein
MNKLDKNVTGHSRISPQTEILLVLLRAWAQGPATDDRATGPARRGAPARLGQIRPNQPAGQPLAVVFNLTAAYRFRPTKTSHRPSPLQTLGTFALLSFLSFTLSGGGLSGSPEGTEWRRHRTPRWRAGLPLCGCTAVEGPGAGVMAQTRS